MTIAQSNECLKRFSELCDALDKSELLKLEECQYWLFELGFKAALEKKTKAKQAPHMVSHKLAEAGDQKNYAELAVH